MKELLRRFQPFRTDCPHFICALPAQICLSSSAFVFESNFLGHNRQASKTILPEEHKPTSLFSTCPVNIYIQAYFIYALPFVFTAEQRRKFII